MLGRARNPEDMNGALFRGMYGKPEYDCVASVVFSSPQLATVGLSEQQALEKHENIDVFLSTFT